MRGSEEVNLPLAVISDLRLGITASCVSNNSTFGYGVMDRVLVCHARNRPGFDSRDIKLFFSPRV